MLEEINKITNKINTIRSQITNYTEQREEQIIILEKQLSEITATIGEKIFYGVITEMNSIKNIIEDSEMFIIDEVLLTKNSSIVISVIYDKEYSYEIKIENGKFVCTDTIEDDDIIEEMRYITNRLNSDVMIYILN